MFTTVRWALQRSRMRFSARRVVPIPAAAGHGNVHHLLAALTVVMLAATLSVVPIPSEMPLVGNLVEDAMAHHEQRCTTTTVTKYHPTTGSYTTTRRTCTTIDHPRPKPKGQAIKEAGGSALFVGLICRGSLACGVGAAVFETLVDPKPSRPRPNGPPCLPGCSTIQPSWGTPPPRRGSGSGHPSGGTG